MHLQQHLFLSYLLPGTSLRERRDRVIVTLAGLGPDVDAPILLAMGEDAFVKYHHDWTHHLAGAFAAFGLALLFGKKRWACAGWAAAAWCLHLLLDMIGAGDRSPGHPFEYRLPLFWPFGGREFEPFAFAWPLNSWQNAAIMVAAIVAMGWMGVRHRRTVLEVLSPRADRAVVTVLLRRFGRSAPDSGTADPPLS
ncbi:MAG: metal-dependent hydrolase [Planctomycetota bacterium]|jgi:hypothetical protein